MRTSLFCGAVLAASAVVVPGALADGDAYDVSPEIVGGVIKVNAYFDDAEFEVKNVRVFGYEFGEDPILPPNELADPGLHPLPGSGFAQNSQIGVLALSTLQYWNGLGSPSFAPAAPGTSMSYAFGSSSATVDGSTIPPGAVLLGPVDANGEFDDHLDTDITLTAPAGIYYFSAKLNTTMVGVADSDSIYFVFAYNADDEALDEAKVFIRDTFAPGTVLPVVPEPSVAALVVAAMLPLVRRRRS